jgi:hypothetical protein
MRIPSPGDPDADRCPSRYGIGRGDEQEAPSSVSGGVFACHGVEVRGVTATFADVDAVVAAVDGMGRPDVAASATVTNGKPFPQIKHNTILTLITHCPASA